MAGCRTMAAVGAVLLRAVSNIFETTHRSSSRSRRSRRNTLLVSVRRAGSQIRSRDFPSEFVSGNYFSTFGLRPYAGRMLTPQDDTAGRRPVVVMSYRAWQQHYGLDPSIVGSIADGERKAIYGRRRHAARILRRPAARRSSRFLYAAWPTSRCSTQTSSILHVDTQHWLYLIGRMKPGVQPSQVEAQLTTELRQWLPTLSYCFAVGHATRSASSILKLGPGGAGITSLRNAYKAGLYMLIAASALVLLIACATWPTCCWRVVWPGGSKPRCNWHWAPAAALDSRLAHGECTAGVHRRRSGTGAGLFRYARHPADRFPWCRIRSHRHQPSLPDPGVCLWAFSAHRNHFWRSSRVDRIAFRSSRSVARRKPFYPRSFGPAAKVAGHRAGRVVAGAAGHGRDGDAEPAQSGAFQLRFQHRQGA